MPRNTKIMVVEDESITAMEIEQFLSQTGYHVVGHAVSHDDAVALARDTHPNLILMDIKLNGEPDGIKTAEDIQELFDVPIIYLTAYADYNTLYRARSTRPCNFISKPFHEDDLNAAIIIALNNHAMEKEIRDHEYWLTSLVNSMDSAIIATDRDCRIKLMNTHAELFIECDEKDVLGKKFEQIIHLVHSDSGKLVSDLCTHMMQSAVSVSISRNVSIVSSKNKIMPVSVKGNPVIDKKGIMLGTVLVIQMLKENEPTP